jgi:heme-degrading monooxygenase HmoA
MFSVIFEVLPNKENWDDYLDNAKMLHPELEQVDGFVDNIRYKSLTREGWILSLSNWRDEKSLVRWRTRRRHHEVQRKGRDEILADYHLRVGQIAADNHVPPGYALAEQRLDETEVGEGTTVTLINATRPAEWKQTNNPYDCAEWLGLKPWVSRQAWPTPVQFGQGGKHGFGLRSRDGVRPDARLANDPSLVEDIGRRQHPKGEAIESGEIKTALQETALYLRRHHGHQPEQQVQPQI